MDDGVGQLESTRDIASSRPWIEKVARSRELDEVICSLRPQYEDGVIEILQVATECNVATKSITCSPLRAFRRC